MTIDKALAEVLDETMKALGDLDATRLQVLEQRIAQIARATVKLDKDDIASVLSKKLQLEIILKNFQVNLDALTRLNLNNKRNQWAQ